MYNTNMVSNKLEIIKKKIIYRASYRGSKEMDILLSTFVNKYLNKFDEKSLVELENLLSFEDEILLNFYHHNIIEKKIDENKISKIFKKFRI